MDRNGEVGFFDVSEFVRLYGDEDEAADMDANGVFDFFDVSLFLEAYTHGCGN